MAEEEPTFSKAILNANCGVSNVIEADVIRDDLLKVIDKLFNILKRHYGPLSEFAALGSRDPLTKTKFTKDGINIIRAIEFASPQEDWVRKTVAFVGERVEASVGDGTTSAMMFTCAMLRHMLKTIHKIKPVSYAALNEAFAVFVEHVERMEKEMLSLSPKSADNMDGLTIYKIVYNQVYAASHGDRYLAQEMAKLYETTPEELWDRMIYERLTYETDTRFKIVYTEGQYQLPCEVMMNGMLNKEFCTWFDHENCTFVVMNNPITMETDAYQYLVELVEKDVSEEQPLVILCHANIDVNTYQDLVEHLNVWSTTGKRVAIFHVNTTMGDWNPDVNDFRTLQLLCDIDITKMKRTQNRNELVVRPHVHVTWRNKTMVLDNLYEVPGEYKYDQRRHMAIDGKHMHYTDYLAAVKKYAEGYSKLPATTANREMTTLMYRTYAKLMYRRVGCVQIGGSVHENVALVDIIDDCVRASARALRQGITFGNNRSLYMLARAQIEGVAICGRLGCRKKLIDWIASNIVLALEDIATAQMELLYPGKKKSRWFKRYFIDYWFTHSVDVLHYHDRTNREDPRIISQYSHAELSAAKSALRYQINNIEGQQTITQPVDTDISMLKRFGEIALKFALSGRIIVSNSAYLDDGKKRR